jgi:hypothetical protein
MKGDAQILKNGTRMDEGVIIMGIPGMGLGIWGKAGETERRKNGMGMDDQGCRPEEVLNGALLYRKGYLMHITSSYARVVLGLKPQEGASQFESVDSRDPLGGFLRDHQGLEDDGFSLLSLGLTSH